MIIESCNMSSSSMLPTNWGYQSACKFRSEQKGIPFINTLFILNSCDGFWLYVLLDIQLYSWWLICFELVDLSTNLSEERSNLSNPDSYNNFKPLVRTFLFFLKLWFDDVIYRITYEYSTTLLLIFHKLPLHIIFILLLFLLQNYFKLLLLLLYSDDSSLSIARQALLLLLNLLFLLLLLSSNRG